MLSDLKELRAKWERAAADNKHQSSEAWHRSDEIASDVHWAWCACYTSCHADLTALIEKLEAENAE